MTCAVVEKTVIHLRQIARVEREPLDGFHARARAPAGNLDRSRHGVDPFAFLDGQLVRVFLRCAPQLPEPGQFVARDFAQMRHLHRVHKLTPALRNGTTTPGNKLGQLIQRAGALTCKRARPLDHVRRRSGLERLDQRAASLAKLQQCALRDAHSHCR